MGIVEARRGHWILCWLWAARHLCWEPQLTLRSSKCSPTLSHLSSLLPGILLPAFSSFRKTGGSSACGFPLTDLHQNPLLRASLCLLFSSEAAFTFFGLCWLTPHFWVLGFEQVFFCSCSERKNRSLFITHSSGGVEVECASKFALWGGVLSVQSDVAFPGEWDIEGQC